MPRYLLLLSLKAFLHYRGSLSMNSGTIVSYCTCTDMGRLKFSRENSYPDWFENIEDHQSLNDTTALKLHGEGKIFQILKHYVANSTPSYFIWVWCTAHSFALNTRTLRKLPLHHKTGVSGYTLVLNLQDANKKWNVIRRRNVLTSHEFLWSFHVDTGYQLSISQVSDYFHSVSN